jgi:hypothetical protein
VRQTIILKYNVFIDRAPYTKLHKREQKDRTKTLVEFSNHVLKDYMDKRKHHYTDVKCNASFDWHNKAFRFIKCNIIPQIQIVQSGSLVCATRA